jgi:excisionase family DNA binding protein
MARILRPEDILTPEELAARLKVPKSWVYEKTRFRNWVRGDPLPSLRLGRYIRFDWTKVVEWLTEDDDGHGQRKNKTRK